MTSTGWPARVGLRADERVTADEPRQLREHRVSRGRRDAGDDDRCLARPRRRLAVRLPPAGHPLRRPRLPPPGRDGLSEAALAEIAELVWAAGGRTLGLFSSRRAAEAAAVYVRKQLPKLTVLCQGDAQLPELTRRFVADESASLFGTLSLWQGVDVPGATCQLVIIDRIPFPRPDEPLTLARQRAVAEAGGNGFMAVAATPRRAAAGPGIGPADPPGQRPGRGRGARPAAGHRPVRRLPPGLDAGRCGRPPTARWSIGALRRLAEA